MKSLLFLILICICQGCTSVERKVYYEVSCKDCVTPYGRGKEVILKIEKYFNIDKNKKDGEQCAPLPEAGTKQTQ